jgi:hypothetical protein
MIEDAFSPQAPQFIMDGTLAFGDGRRVEEVVFDVFVRGVPASDHHTV